MAIDGASEGAIDVSRKTIAVLCAVSVLCAAAANHLGQACSDAGFGVLSVLLAPDDVLTFFTSRLMRPFLFSFGFDALLFTALGAFLPFALFYGLVLRSRRDYMYNAEYGTARWGTQAESDAFADTDDEFNNIILSDTDRMVFVPHKFDIKTDRNKNVLLLGGPGSGKTRYNVKPNLMQLNSSYVVIDPKGTLVPEMGKLFCGEDGYVPDECKFRATQDLYLWHRGSDGSKEKILYAKAGEYVAYNMRVLNLIDFSKSNYYNPFAYMGPSKDVLKLVTVFIKNTEDASKSGGDAFWTKAETLFYQAIFSYLLEECSEDERNFSSVLDLINAAKVKEDDEDYESPLDYLFKEVETGMAWDDEVCEWVQVARPKPDAFCVRQYKKFKLAAGKTLKSILISCAARLALFEQADVRELMSCDELRLDSIGDVPTILFLILPDTDKDTFKAISAMCLYQMFDLLCAHADNDCGGKLPVPIQCYFDEFANVGTIPDFDSLITTIRSRGISAEIVLQNLGQLDRDYDKAARIIKGGCATTIYLGNCDHETCKEISEQMGNRTIAAASLTKNDGQQRSTSLSDQLIQRSLEDPAEVRRMDATECRVLISGTYPQRSKKYRLERHPRYKYIDPGHDGAAYVKPFDATAYIEAMRRSALRGSEVSYASESTLGMRSNAGAVSSRKIEVTTDMAAMLTAEKVT